MPQPSQFSFSYREMLELMIKQCGVREGKWMLVFNFGFAAGNFGIGPDEAAPGVLTSIQSVSIAKTEDSNVPQNLIMDASQVEFD